MYLKVKSSLTHLRCTNYLPNLHICVMRTSLGICYKPLVWVPLFSLFPKILLCIFKFRHKNGQNFCFTTDFLVSFFCSQFFVFLFGCRLVPLLSYDYLFELLLVHTRFCEMCMTLKKKCSFYTYSVPPTCVFSFENRI